jgi:hypothetical protein
MNLKKYKQWLNEDKDDLPDVGNKIDWIGGNKDVDDHFREVNKNEDPVTIDNPIIDFDKYNYFKIYK